jgi:hypothetical protein
VGWFAVEVAEEFEAGIGAVEVGGEKACRTGKGAVEVGGEKAFDKYQFGFGSEGVAGWPSPSWPSQSCGKAGSHSQSCEEVGSRRRGRQDGRPRRGRWRAVDGGGSRLGFPCCCRLA